MDNLKRRKEECSVRNHTEIRFLEKTKALLPPTEECLQEVFQKIHSLDEKDARKFDQIANKTSVIILDPCVPNPIMIDPLFQIPHSDPYKFHPKSSGRRQRSSKNY